MGEWTYRSTYVFTEPLLSNGYTCHIGPSVRLFVPNTLQAYSHLFFSRGLCLQRLWLGPPSLPWLGCWRCLLSNRSRISLLNSTRPEWLPDKVPVDPDVSPSTFLPPLFQMVGHNWLEWPVFPHFHFLLRVQSLFPFRRGPTPPQCSVTHFPQPAGNPSRSFHDLQHESLPECLVEFPLVS
jgi:hypothetical protein